MIFVRISRCYIIYLIFLVFVLSNTHVLHDVSVLFWCKHAVIIFLSLMGLCLFLIQNPCGGLFRLMQFLILYSFSCFFFDQNIIVLSQMVIFLFAIYYLSFIIGHVNADNIVLFLFLFLIALCPLLLDVLFSGGFIYNSFYGRPRMLLGYFHPKEAANVFVGVFLLFFVLTSKPYNIRCVLFFILTCVLVYFIDSRNSFLMVVNVFLFSFLIRKLGYKALFFIFLLFWVFLFFIISENYELANSLMSLRLDVWVEALTRSHGLWGNLSNLTGLHVDVIHDDNYYITRYVESGIVFVFLITFLFIFLVFALKERSLVDDGVPTVVVVYALFFESFFDAGLFSTGNIINIMCWSLIFLHFRKMSILTPHVERRYDCI